MGLDEFQCFTHFHEAMKPGETLKKWEEIERAAVSLLRDVLGRVPFITVENVRQSRRSGDRGIDVLADVSVNGTSWSLLCEVKSHLLPSVARDVASRLWLTLEHSNQPRVYAILIAPFLSEKTRAICSGLGIGWLDFAGNAHLCFDTVFIELAGKPARQPSPKKVWSGLFGSKSERILRRLMREPQRSWKVVELAGETGTSVGLVSNVRRALIDQEWAAADADGFRLRRPEELLDAWKAIYRPSTGDRLGFHTLLHGSALTEAVKSVLAEGEGRVILAGTAAAQWLAPYAGGGPLHLYADPAGLDSVRRHLRLKPVSRGANVVVDRPTDDGVFLDAVEPAPGIRCTGPVQTFLDLTTGNDRFVEAAGHLRTELLDPLFRADTP